MTLVCTLIFMLSSPPSAAAPSTDFPPDPIDSGLHPRPKEPTTPRTDLMESTQITTTPGMVTTNGDTPLIPTRKLTDEAVFLVTGLWRGSVVDNGLNDNIAYFRIGKSVYDGPTLANEYTLDLSTSGNFGWSAGYKFLQDLGKNYEPYLKVALGALYASNERLGTFINWERYQLRGEIGCDDLFQMQRSLRAELGVSWSGYGMGLYGGLAYAF